MPIKRAMLEAHQSQKTWLLKHHGVTDFTAGMETQSSRRGKTYGVAYAEVFRQYRHPPYPRTTALQGLLGPDLL
jgi:hypothetical protein